MHFSFAHEVKLSEYCVHITCRNSSFICTRTVVTSSQTSLIASCILSQARISLLQHFWHQCLAGFAQKCSNLSWREVTAMWVVKWPFVCVNLQRFLYCFDEGSCDGRQIKHIRSVNCNFWELWSIYREHEDFQILDSKEGQCKSHKFVKILHLHYILAINISQRQLTATIN